MTDDDFEFVSGCIAAHPHQMGGQHVARHCSAVIAIHKVTGIAFRVSDERSQFKAKERAVAEVEKLIPFDGPLTDYDALAAEVVRLRALRDAALVWRHAKGKHTSAEDFLGEMDRADAVLERAIDAAGAGGEE